MIGEMNVVVKLDKQQLKHIPRHLYICVMFCRHGTARRPTFAKSHTVPTLFTTTKKLLLLSLNVKLDCSRTNVMSYHIIRFWK